MNLFKKNSWFNWSTLIFFLLLLLTFITYFKAVYQFISNNLNILSFIGSLLVGTVGLVALYLYDKQKKDNKKETANIILLEIQNAERMIKQIKDELLYKPFPMIPVNIFTMPSESWSSRKYLFVGDFDRNEWDTITDFYNNCRLYDEAVKLNNSYFEKNTEQLRVNLQKKTADDVTKAFQSLLKATPENKKKLLEKINQDAKDFFDFYAQSSMQYKPQKALDDAKQAIGGLDNNISLTSIGIKLKEISKRQFLNN